MAGEQQGKAAPKAATLVEVEIWRGTYVTADAEFGPGKKVMVEPEEAAALKARGFVKPDNYAPPEEDGRVKIATEDAASVTIGRL